MIGISANDLMINPFKTACFTGHRPEKMPFDTEVRFFRESFQSVLYLHAYEAVNRGYDTFLCGMQRGTDIWAGQAVMRVKEVCPHVRLICVSPYREEINGRRGADNFDYCELRDSCDSFVVLQREYSRGCYQKRNEYMVNNSSLIIGAVADRKSGTGQTLAYAKRRGLDVEEIDLVKFAEQYHLYI